MTNAIITFSNGVRVINTTPHNLTFLDGSEVINVPTSGVLVNARPVEEIVSSGVVTLVKTTFAADPTSASWIDSFQQEHPEVLIVGSIIAAQAFPGKVVGMTPAPGFERVAPSEKRMSVSKFTTFA